ncbi:hypothetical protein AB0N38_14015 [Micromonospora aurantiaca]|uniref:hypothetical protein n=1 Tax=Micromonospora aurantiaca (nom. illeg.) TaxID=47850 RepID=UPI00343847A7
MTAKPKRNNLEFVYETLRDLGEVPAKQVMAATGLSNSASTDNLRRLVAAGRVERREDFDAMAAGSGTVVLWRVLEQHETPAGSDEPPANPDDVAAALDEIAAEQPPTVVQAARKGDHQDAAVVELPELDPAAPIEVADDRPASVADVIADELPAHSVDLNVTEPQDETPADGHWPTADEVDAGVAEWEQHREDVDRSNYDREVQQGTPDGPDDEPPSEPASDNPGDVLAYMQSVRPVSPAPVGEPAPRQRRTRASSGEPRDTSAFYKRGALSEQIVAWMREHADQSYSPTDVAKALGAQTGSVGYAMDKLTAAGTLRLTQPKPKRYQATTADVAQ